MILINAASIYLNNFTSYEHFKSYLNEHRINRSLYLTAVTFLGVNEFLFAPPPDDIVLLVSGSIPFLNDQTALIRKIKVFLLLINTPDTEDQCLCITSHVLGYHMSWWGVHLLMKEYIVTFMAFISVLISQHPTTLLFKTLFRHRFDTLARKSGI